MTRHPIHALLLVLLTVLSCFASSFDERLWENYAEISGPQQAGKNALAGIYLEPGQLGDTGKKAPLADLRVMTDRKEETPWQIIVQRPEKQPRELSAQTRNLSLTPDGETWVEIQIEPQPSRSDTVEVITPDSNFSRQVQVLGSPDGLKWNSLRKDGVIFDNSRHEKSRLTRITFPPSNFRYLALKISNNGEAPLTISAIKVFEDARSDGQTYSITGSIGTIETDAERQETSMIVTMKTVFPLNRLTIATPDRNFQRTVEVQVRQDGSDWGTWASGTIYNFDTPTIRESLMTVEIPEIATREFRLIFRNHDNPPLKSVTVNGEGYRRLLVFKQDPERKQYLFWGNPAAITPSYDLAALVARQKLSEIPTVYLGKQMPNTKFAGDNARKPFTERYKYLLYGIVGLAIVGLIFLQYRVFKRIGIPL
jgi:hypothetical protein